MKINQSKPRTPTAQPRYTLWMWILKSKAHTQASMSLLSLTAVAAPMRLYRVAQLDEAPRWHRQHGSGDRTLDAQTRCPRVVR